MSKSARSAHPAWPISVLLIGFPLWWALGLADFMWIILAIPMVFQMVGWSSQGRRVRLPPGFGLWLLFLLCALAGIVVLGLQAPDTVASSLSHRLLSYGDRTLGYLGDTVILVYAGNLTEEELPRRRMAWMLGLLAIVTTVGGVAGMVAPHFQFNSPLMLLLPKSLQANTFIQASMEPGFAQVQNVLGQAAGRPKAPFDYTNIWGECLSLLLPWLIVGWWSLGTQRQRRIAGTTLVICIAPLLYSLNRGVWIGIIFSVVYLAVRLAAVGKRALLRSLIVGAAIFGLVILVSPLHTVVSGRLANGKSDNLRSNLSSLSVRAAETSPLIGYGDTRQERGSPQSIAVGPSPACPSCGQLAVGSTGQLWLLLVCSGFLGAGLFLSFFAYAIWRFRRDRSPYGLAGMLILLLSFIYMFAYDATGAPLGLICLSYGLLWKSDLFARGSASTEQHEEAVISRPPRLTRPVLQVS